MTTVISDLNQLPGLVGTHLGYSDWFPVLQDRVDLFADATEDHQWIHVDPERAKHGPFGGTIAHGYLTLALISALIGQCIRVEGMSMGVNYGCNKVRFPAPVLVGSAVRLGIAVNAVEVVSGGFQVVLDATIEAKGTAKPCCVAQVVYRYYF